MYANTSPRARMNACLTVDKASSVCDIQRALQNVDGRTLRWPSVRCSVPVQLSHKQAMGFYPSATRATSVITRANRCYKRGGDVSVISSPLHQTAPYAHRDFVYKTACRECISCSSVHVSLLLYRARGREFTSKWRGFRAAQSQPASPAVPPHSLS